MLNVLLIVVIACLALMGVASTVPNGADAVGALFAVIVAAVVVGAWLFTRPLAFRGLGRRAYVVADWCVGLVERLFPLVPEAGYEDAHLGLRWLPPHEYYFLDDANLRVLSRVWAILRLDRPAVSFWRRRGMKRREQQAEAKRQLIRKFLAERAPLTAQEREALQEQRECGIGVGVAVLVVLGLCWLSGLWWNHVSAALAR